MTNWCYSSFSFYADTILGKQQLEDFCDKFEKAIAFKRQTFVHSFSCSWLGNIIQYFCPQLLKITREGVFCDYDGRNIEFNGEIVTASQYMDSDGNFHFNIISLNSSLSEMWDMILKTCGYSDIKYVYISEDHDRNIFINTDIDHRFYDDKYYLIYCLPFESEEFADYCASDKELLKSLNYCIKALSAEYKRSGQDYELPADFDIATLRAQRSVTKAHQLLLSSIFKHKTKDIAYFINIDEFSSC